MELLMKLLPFGRNKGHMLAERLQTALHSLHARGLVQSFQTLGDDAFRMQWDRGNFGLDLRLAQEPRGWTVRATSICNPAGPFGNAIAGEILPLLNWVACGKAVQYERAERAQHVELVEWLCGLEAGHPAIEWLNQQFRRLAAGEGLGSEELQALVLLGARRFLKTIPGADRLHESIEPALVTLLRISGKAERPNAAVTGAELDVIAGEDYSRALLEFLRETHPLESRRAAHRYVSSL